MIRETVSPRNGSEQPREEPGREIVASGTRVPEGKKSGGGILLSASATIRKIRRLLVFTVYTLSPAERAVYITSDEPDPGFIRYFYPGATVTPVRRIGFWSLRRSVRDYDSAMISMHPRLMRLFPGGLFTVPWIRQRLRLDVPFEQLFEDRERKRERKKALAFEFAISRDPVDLELFYETMYLPFLRKRYEFPTILGLDYLREHYLEKNGELLLIKNDDRVIAGGLCNLERGTYSLDTLGMRDEASSIEGVNAALYYYGILMAYKRGADYVDFGVSRPFLQDGVVMYKRKWGGSIHRDDRNNRVIYLKNLVKNGLIVLEDGTLRAVVSGDEVFFTRSYPDEGIERSARHPEP